MEVLSLLLIVMFSAWVVFKLGLFNPIVNLAQVADRESFVYNRSHKIKVAKRYQDMSADVDVVKVNETIAKIDALQFD